MAGVSCDAKAFTPKQGQYLAFIHLYMRLHRRPPAEADMQEYFRVSPPSVHQMVLTLEREDSSDASRASLAASKCSLIRTACQSYFDPGFNLSKSLCSGTRSWPSFVSRWNFLQKRDEQRVETKRLVAPAATVSTLVFVLWLVGRERFPAGSCRHH